MDAYYFLQYVAGDKAGNETVNKTTIVLKPEQKPIDEKHFVPGDDYGKICKPKRTKS